MYIGTYALVLTWSNMDKLISRIEKWIRKAAVQFKTYIKKLLIPLYLFPIKLITYSAYYLIKFCLKFALSLIQIIFDIIKYPFKGLKNFIKSIFFLIFGMYILLSLLVIADYTTENYGHITKFFCGYSLDKQLNKSVVRIVGGYSEGSGFFISESQVITSFHVIADEPSPKIIFSDGSFVTPIKILGDENLDLAVLITEKEYPDLVLDMMEPVGLYDGEPLISAGYALGTDLEGDATIQRGRFVAFRDDNYYIQTDINLIEGMSGGPLLDKCGQVVGVNTSGLSGLSLFVAAGIVNAFLPGFNESDIAKIDVDPSLSPENAVYAFYTYLKARKMQDGFNLLSKEYLKKTDFKEWTNRFTDILDVQIYISEPYENTNNTAFVKFETKNWNNSEVTYHYYEGTWETVLENGVYKMDRSKILEVIDPSWDWYYE
jgi:hypothetical protein